MIRAVVDVNVLVSATLTPGGTPHRVLERWVAGAFEMVVSLQLLAELDRVLARQEIVDRGDSVALETLSDAIAQDALLVDDPTPERFVTRDPKDDYLVALARAAGAHVIVTGDRHLLDIDDLRPPALEPRAFLSFLERLPE